VFRVRGRAVPVVPQLPVGRPAGSIHLGNCAVRLGAHAERFAAHESQLFAIPSGVTDEAAVLADPFSVSLRLLMTGGPWWCRGWSRRSGSSRRRCTSHYFDFVSAGYDLTPGITHRFPLERWDEAVLALKDAARTGAVKVLLEPRRRPPCATRAGRVRQGTHTGSAAAAGRHRCRPGRNARPGPRSHLPFPAPLPRGRV
jgi:hypothetical protein